MVRETETRTERGISLSRGPALLLGTILLAAGLYFIYKQHTFPKFANFPNGKAPVEGKVLFAIFGANGWTGMLTAIGGGLLLFGAAQHLLAKTMSLVVGVALAAAAIIALASGNVLGLAAANGWTEIGWAGAAAILLFNTIVPRRRRTVVGAGAGAGTAGAAEADRRGGVAPSRRAGAGTAAAAGATGGAGAAAVAEHERDRPAGQRAAEADRPGGASEAPAARELAASRGEAGDPARGDVAGRPGAGDAAGRPGASDAAGRPGAGDAPRRTGAGEEPPTEVGNRE